MRITVFTPTYNRGYIIEKLYHSLQRQTFQDFEWVVVDDGSTDNTEDLFNQILSEDNFFPIHYQKNQNGGKHRAINKGVALAKGDLFCIVDSDDYLTDDALKIIDEMEQSIPKEQRKKFGGVCGQRGYDIHTPIGKTFAGDVLDITVLERAMHKVTGDKAEVIYTDIMRKYPFPEFEGENFLTECVVWDKMAADGYKLRFFNHICIICNYLPDGLTAREHEILVKNPKGWGQYIYQCGVFGKTAGLGKWNEYLQYFYAVRKKLSFFEIAHNLHINPIILWLRLSGMRLFYRIYNQEG